MVKVNIHGLIFCPSSVTNSISEVNNEYKGCDLMPVILKNDKIEIDISKLIIREKFKEFLIVYSNFLKNFTNDSFEKDTIYDFSEYLRNDFC